MQLEKTIFNSKRITIIITGVIGLILTITLVLAASGDLLGTVNLPGNGNCAVAGTFDGTYYMTMEGGFVVGCAGTVLQIFQPPIGGNGSATLVATKNIVNTSNNSVIISELAWDPNRGKVWGAYDDKIYLIDIGIPNVSGNAIATFQFNAGVGGNSLVDGLAYDGSDDTLYYSPDVDCLVYHFSTNGTLLNSISPKNVSNVSDCYVSGVTVGTNNTLYIGRNGFAEIRRIDKTTGNFISQFATTSGRVEALTCDPITYAPKEAILAKNAYNSLYEAFEVETGTCPIAGCTDVDGDGFAIEGGNCGSIDCDDNNINVNQNVTEICDGVDNDCDQLIDEGFDKDNDGVADCFDYCPNSKPNEPVDQNGCDIFQFCEPLDCGTKCFYADWKNNEPNTKYPNDCTVVVVLRNGKEQQPKCVPTEFSDMCAG